MKKSFCLLFFCFLPIVSTTASDENIFDDFAPCYSYSLEKQKNIPTEYTEICNIDRNTENFPFLSEESKAFQEKIFDVMNTDNGSNANWIAEKGVLELRKHHACLLKICHDIFEFCSRSQNSGDWTLESQRWCSDRVSELDAIARTKLFVIANGNQARKDRSLLKEKNMAIETRFNAYFQHWMPQVVNGLRNFTDKVTVFIMMPF